jgi:hypothetical protein
MKYFFGTLLSAGLALSSFAQSNNQATAIEENSDDFTSATSLNNWQQFHTTENYPNKIRSLSIENGILNLQPYASGWYADFQAPFLYKTIVGDFDVRTKVKVSGLTGELPDSEWSLAGLMIRQAKRGTSENWQPRLENWLFITTGIAEPKGSPMFEVKTTNNSLSNLKLRPAKKGWVELRAVRVQASFILMYRYEGEQWTILERFYRPLLPPQLQVGLNAYTGWNQIPMEVSRDAAAHNTTLLKDIPTDMLFQVDYIHFKKPALNMEKLNALVTKEFRAPYYSPPNVLTDYAITNAQVLAIVGD